MNPTTITTGMNIVEQIALLPTRTEKRAFCIKKAEEFAANWFAGQKEQIDRIVNSKQYRYRNLGYNAKRVIAQEIWRTSPQAKNISGDEQMLCRWASMYKD